MEDWKGCIISKMHMFSHSDLYNTAWTPQKSLFFLFGKVDDHRGGWVTG